MADTEGESAGELARKAIGQLRELVRVEAELAKREAARQARQFVASIVGFAIAVGLVSSAFAMGIVALFLAVGPSAVSAAAIGGGLALAGALIAAVAARHLPKDPMSRTAARVQHEARDVKEAIAS